MGYIKEPEGIDFEINGKPLTEEQKIALTAFIKADKAQKVLQVSHHKTRTGGKRPAKRQSV